MQYVKYLFTGLVMNAVIKGFTTDLPPNALFFSMDYSEVFSLEPFEQVPRNASVCAHAEWAP